MADQYMSFSGRYSFRDLDPIDAGSVTQPTTMPVIPPPSANYPYSDGDGEVSSSSSDADTLTTPPPRRQRHRISQRATAPSYASAPIPPGIVYPQAAEAAIPVPPPSGGSGTSRLGYPREEGPYTTPGTSYQPLTPLRTSRSHKHFDKEGYLDPAFLASSSAEDVNVAGRGAGRSRY
jgi:hypothetical protein